MKYTHHKHNQSFYGSFYFFLYLQKHLNPIISCTEVNFWILKHLLLYNTRKHYIYIYWELKSKAWKLHAIIIRIIYSQGQTIHALSVKSTQKEIFFSFLKKFAWLSRFVNLNIKKSLLFHCKKEKRIKNLNDTFFIRLTFQ